MPSSYTTRIRLEKQADGENANTWGLKLNQNVIDLVDEGIAGYETIVLSGATSLTAVNGTTDQSRNFGLKFTGTLSADTTVTIPAQEKIYFVRNDTSGDYNLLFKNAGGTAVTGPSQQLGAILATDGTSVTTMLEADSTIFATVSALVATSAALQADINANSGAIAAVSATMATSINNANVTRAATSAALQSNINANTSAIAAVSTTMATSINNANVTRAATSATLNTRITNTSAALQSDIDANSTAIAAVATSIASTNTRVTNTSAALQSDIDANTAAISTVSTAITTRSNQVSSTAESRIAGVSTVLSQTSSTLNTRINNVATSIASTNTRVTNTSATLDSRITSVSNNSVQTGTSVSFTKIKVSTGPLTVQTVSGTGVNFLTPAGAFCGRVQAQATGSDLQVVVNDSDGGGEFEIINNSNDALFRVQGETGTVTNKSGVYGTISDQSMKTSVTQLTGSLDKISNIQGSKFTRIGLAGKQVGFVAQNIQPHIPEVVMNQPDDNGLLSVNTVGLIPFLVEAVKELKAKVSVLENN